MCSGMCCILPEQVDLDQLQNDLIYNLTKCFDSDDDDSPFEVSHDCPYKSSEEFYSDLGKNKISLVSVNTRSISGKWNEVCNFLGGDSQGNLIDFMSLQEVWNVPPNVCFTANGYHPLVYNTRDLKGLSPNIGGGGIYN